jgi:hypothetical protein
MSMLCYVMCVAIMLVLALLVIFNEISIRSNHKGETYTPQRMGQMGAIQQTEDGEESSKQHQIKIRRLETYGKKGCWLVGAF